jgi:ABC-type glutathione transport system ATPase component
MVDVEEKHGIISSKESSPQLVSIGGSTPCEIRFRDLKYSVLVKGQGKISKDRKYILKGITGKCVPGRLLAIMGSSGAGKTTVSF